MGDEAQLDRKRLHITPFSSTLLDRFIPPSIRPLASGISFHTVETFPERAFGYVELPVMEAEKLKKRLNGMTLKGAKVRIEDAKPEKKRKAEADAETEEERKVRKKSKRELKKREEGVLVGHEMEEGRRVKRGWTDDGSEKKKDKKSKKVKSTDESSNGKKLRFKTVVPPNQTPVDGKAKVNTDDKKDRKEKEKRGKKTTVVQEFGKAQKPVITGGISANSKAARFEEGQGWVDEEGNVVEAPAKSTRPKRERRVDNVSAAAPSPNPVKTAVNVNTAESDSDEEVSSVVSSDTSSDADVDSDSEDDTPEPNKAPPTIYTQVVTTPDDETLIDAPAEVHPLEALFKRPAPKPESATKPKPSPIDTSFSFFTSGPAAEVAEDERDGEARPPQTPHTKEDLEWRSVRSAAPTPDTAAIGKRFDFPLAKDEDDELEDVDEGDEDVGEVGQQEDVHMGDSTVDAAGIAVDGERQESDFRKWFYDNRGDLNRGWKKRRRDERKQKRQRENKRLGRRVA
ncbi:hypothetical protein LTR56_004534 [Elasticomyces elasticus]|nr:hypothetical protein LTR56_004534 [Elasticomyces elasticus]KAK3654266.1 hypothetical protein LTR22_010893 [Elasticomyces elasticus]KAK4919960.1 hypothetical protein LTR49_012397 [Elasticomyces elasticus]KAK5758794.1 hypothetical protein LTS12_011034 [Elasticomyces elasticus]